MIAKTHYPYQGSDYKIDLGNDHLKDYLRLPTATCCMIPLKLSHTCHKVLIDSLKLKGTCCINPAYLLHKESLVSHEWALYDDPQASSDGTVPPVYGQYPSLIFKTPFDNMHGHGNVIQPSYSGAQVYALNYRACFESKETPVRNCRFVEMKMQLNANEMLVWTLIEPEAENEAPYFALFRQTVHNIDNSHRLLVAIEVKSRFISPVTNDLTSSLLVDTRLVDQKLACIAYLAWVKGHGTWAGRRLYRAFRLDPRMPKIYKKLVMRRYNGPEAIQAEAADKEEKNGNDDGGDRGMCTHRTAWHESGLMEEAGNRHRDVGFMVEDVAINKVSDHISSWEKSWILPRLPLDTKGELSTGSSSGSNRLAYTAELMNALRTQFNANNRSVDGVGRQLEDDRSGVPPWYLRNLGLEQKQMGQTFNSLRITQVATAHLLTYRMNPDLLKKISLFVDLASRTLHDNNQPPQGGIPSPEDPPLQANQLDIGSISDEHQDGRDPVVVPSPPETLEQQRQREEDEIRMTAGSTGW